VKLMTTRGDDVRHGRSRPAGVHHVRVAVNGGRITSFEHRLAGPLLDLRYGLLGERMSARHAAADPKGNNESVPIIVKVPYAVGATSVSFKVQELAIPTSAFRSVYSGTVGTINEIVISELAGKMNRDEYEFRRELLDGDPYRAVLDTVASEGQWGRITRCTIAVDPGRVVNPRGLESTLMGVTMDAIATVFTAGLHIDRGAVRETGFADYRWTRMFDSPLDIKVHVLAPTAGLPGGAGELGFPAAAAAAANAWARATGRTVRRFPINEYGAG
jgi:isoquinoline 1-oxidoreductase beta subunit